MDIGNWNSFYIFDQNCNVITSLSFGSGSPQSSHIWDTWVSTYTDRFNLLLVPSESFASSLLSLFFWSVCLQHLITSVTSVALYTINFMIAYPMLLGYYKSLRSALEHILLCSVNHLSVHLAPFFLPLLLIFSHICNTCTAGIDWGWLGMLWHDYNQLVIKQGGATVIFFLKFLSWATPLSVIEVWVVPFCMYQFAEISLFCNVLLSQNTCPCLLVIASVHKLLFD